jgi:hypothetical protein
VGASLVLEYLSTLPEAPRIGVNEFVRRVNAGGIPAVTKDDLSYLALAEEREAQRLGLPHFKFADDATMLHRIEEEKTRSLVSAA